MSEGNMNSEHVEQRPGDIDAFPKKELQHQETAEVKPDFSQRLSDIRATSGIRKEQIDSLLEPEIARSEARDKRQEPISLEEARSQFEELSQDQSLPSSDYLYKSQQIQGSIFQQRYQILREQRSLEDQASASQTTIQNEIDLQLQTQNQKKGFDKIPAFFKKMGLKKEKSRAEERIASYIKQAQSKSDEAAQIEEFDRKVKEKEEPIRQKHNEHLAEEVTERVQSIKNDYAQLAKEVLEDGRIPDEVREAYIQDRIARYMEYEGYHVSEEKKQEFYKALRSAIEHRGETDEEKQPSLEKLNQNLADMGMYFLRDEILPLLGGKDEMIVQDFIAKLAASDIIPARRKVETYARDLEIKYAPYHSDSFSFDDKFDDKFHEELYNAFPDIVPNQTDISSWNALKNSPTALASFGDEIKNQDQEYYNIILDKSVADNYEAPLAIRMLYYYSTPDAIRNLVLIFSSSSGNHDAAKDTLTYLSERKDWKEILDNAAKTYPSIIPLVPILETQYSDNPLLYRADEIQNKAGELALSTFEDPSVDERLRKVALDALPNRSILDVLVKRDIIRNSDAADIKEAQKILDDLINSPPDNLDVPISVFYFRKAVRDATTLLLGKKEQTGTEDTSLQAEQQETVKKQVERLTTLSQKIKEKSSDYNALSYLSSHQVINKMIDQSLNEGDIPVFLDAYTQYPDLVLSDLWNKRELLTKFSAQFNGQETIDLFKKLSTLYTDPEQLVKVVDLFNNKSWTEEERGSVLEFTKVLLQDSSPSSPKSDEPAPVVAEQESEQINNLEKELGLENKEERLIEAALFIDQKFLNTAIITGNTQNPEMIFGNNAWMDYLEARLAAKKYGSQKLTADFILDLQSRLTKRYAPEHSGKFRETEAHAADHDTHEAITYTQEQLETVRDNPLISFTQAYDIESGPIEHTGFISYSRPEDIMNNINELCKWYNSTKETVDYNSFQAASILQQRIASIHPFVDGNGILSRVLMNWSLENDGQSPSILDNPDDDILSTDEKWTSEVENGSKKYREIKERQKAMRNVGIEDMPALFGVGEEKAFYDYIFKYIKKAPLLVSKNGRLKHSEYEQFREPFIGGLRLFKNSFNPNSEIETQEGSIILPQGGLISSGFIKSAAITNFDTSITKDNFLPNLEIYRGGVCEDEMTDEKICSMFTTYTGVETGYRALRKSGVRATSSHSVDPKTITEAMDYYNKSLSSFFFESLNANDKNPYGEDSHVRDFKSTVGDHIRGSPELIWNSPFASASIDIGQARNWARKTSDTYKSGIMVRAWAPKEGSILTFGNDLPSIKEVFFHPGEKEVLIAGGLQPSSIHEIEVYGTSALPTIVARRAEHQGAKGIEIEKRQEGKSEKRFYKFNPQTNSFELET